MGKKCFLVYLKFIAQFSKQKTIFIIAELQLLFLKWHQLAPFFSMWRKLFSFGESGGARKKNIQGELCSMDFFNPFQRSLGFNKFAEQLSLLKTHSDFHLL